MDHATMIVWLSFGLLLSHPALAEDASGGSDRNLLETALLQKSAEFDEKYWTLDPENGKALFSGIGTIVRAIEATQNQLFYESNKSEVARLKKRRARLEAVVVSNARLRNQVRPIREACGRVYSALMATREAKAGSTAYATRLTAERAAHACMKKYPMLLDKVIGHARECAAVEADIREALGLRPTSKEQ